MRTCCCIARSRSRSVFCHINIIAVNGKQRYHTSRGLTDDCSDEGGNRLRAALLKLGRIARLALFPGSLCPTLP